MSITIIVADDHKLMRDGLRTLLEREPDMEVAAEADSGRSALQLAAEIKPTLVIMDIAMPDMNGIEATRKIVAEVPETRVLALSMHPDKRFIVEILKAGASGYLLKNCAFEELASAVRTVLRGRTYLCPEVAELVIGDYVDQLRKGDGSAFSVLSAREREVLQLLAEGKGTADIADRLCISSKTVETYRRHIMDKLNMRSIAELTKYALREGLTSL